MSLQKHNVYHLPGTKLLFECLPNSVCNISKYQGLLTLKYEKRGKNEGEKVKDKKIHLNHIKIVHQPFLLHVSCSDHAKIRNFSHHMYIKMMIASAWCYLLQINLEWMQPWHLNIHFLLRLFFLINTLRKFVEKYSLKGWIIKITKNELFQSFCLYVLGALV